MRLAAYWKCVTMRYGLSRELLMHLRASLSLFFTIAWLMACTGRMGCPLFPTLHRQNQLSVGPEPAISKKTLLSHSDAVIDLIKEDLMRHQATLIPYKGTHGSKMVILSKEYIRVLSGDQVYAEFQDGHYSGQMLLSYKIRNGKISWRVLYHGTEAEYVWNP
jgi:hypothetical protein